MAARKRPPSKYDGLLQELGIDETYTRRPGNVVYDRVKESLPPLEDYNFQADLMALPTTKKGYRYLLVVLDLHTDEFDARPLHSKRPAETTRELKAIFKGKYLKKPYATLRTDGGTEFKGEFHAFLQKSEVIHSVTVAGRHKQNQAVERLNGVISRFVMGYLNRKEAETGAQYREWTDVLPQIIARLNKLRRREPEDPTTHQYGATPVELAKRAKYKEGDFVVPVLAKPQDALGNKLGGETFRQGDVRWDFKNPRRITRVVYYPRNVRYVLEGRTNVAYTEAELQLAPEQDGEKRQEVRKIVGKRKGARGRVEYQVWFKGDKKADAVWLPLSQLKEDGLQEFVAAYNRS